MKCVIIGGDAAGISAASQIRRMKPDWQVTVYEKGYYISYAACGMPYYVADAVHELDDLIELTPEEAVSSRGIDLCLGHEVTGIDPGNRSVTVQSGSKVFSDTWDRLMIATGASPACMGIPVHEMKSVHTINSLPQAEALKSYIKSARPARMAVIGGGYIGLEMAEAVRSLGIETILVHRREDLHRAFEKEISDIIKNKLRDEGVILHFGHSLETITEDESGAIVVTDGGDLRVDGAVLAVGVEPNSKLAIDAGIGTGRAGAIRVNEFMETDLSGIYAAGDCATATLAGFGMEVHAPLALKANKQGRIGGTNMAGVREPFAGVLNTAITKIFDLGVARTGLSFAEAESLGLNPVKYTVESRDRARYYPGMQKIHSLVIVSKKDRRVLGAQLAGALSAVKRIDVYSTAIYNRMTIDRLMDLDLAYAPPFSPVYDPVLLASRIGSRKV